MPDDVVIDQFHLTVLVPCGLRPAEAIAVRRTLNVPTFRAAMRRAVTTVVRRYPDLRKVRVTVTR